MVSGQINSVRSTVSTSLIQNNSIFISSTLKASKDNLISRSPFISLAISNGEKIIPSDAISGSIFKDISISTSVRPLSSAQIGNIDFCEHFLIDSAPIKSINWTHKITDSNIKNTVVTVVANECNTLNPLCDSFCVYSSTLTSSRSKTDALYSASVSSVSNIMDLNSGLSQVSLTENSLSAVSKSQSIVSYNESLKSAIKFIALNDCPVWKSPASDLVDLDTAYGQTDPSIDSSISENIVRDDIIFQLMNTCPSKTINKEISTEILAERFPVWTIIDDDISYEDIDEKYLGWLIVRGAHETFINADNELVIL